MDYDDDDGPQEYAQISGTAEDVNTVIGVIQDTRSSILNTDQEFEAIGKAEHFVLAKETERSAVTSRLQEELDALTERYEAAARAAQRPEGTLSADQYEQRVRELEEDQYASGKAVNEDSNGVARREAELTRARSDRDEVRKWDVTATSDDSDASKVLRLQLYSSLGFSLLDDGAKMLVRNDAGPDVHTVPLADDADRVATANRLWELAGTA